MEVVITFYIKTGFNIYKVNDMKKIGRGTLLSQKEFKGYN